MAMKLCPTRSGSDASGVDSSLSPARRAYFHDGRDWFLQRRFGMFIHWGIYALTEQHEQVQWRRNLSPSDYVGLAGRFCPRRFDPDAWLDLAEQAGMEYLCFTAKHHDGFCMWDTEASDFKITNTPFKRDVLDLLAQACRRRGMPLCLYYSVVDWHHPSYPNQGRSHELAGPKAGDRPDLARYMDYVREQVTELCTRYGPIHGFWWDINSLEHHDPAVNELIRRYQPHAVINNRGFDDGDFSTPERESTGKPQPDGQSDRPFEACNSVGSESWGYRHDEDYYALRHLKAGICTALTKGGNYLLNVGPDADGMIPQQSRQILQRLGKWYERVRPAFCDAAPVTLPENDSQAVFTRRGNSLYVHLPHLPMTASLRLKPIDRLPARAVILNNGSQVESAVSWLPSRFTRDDRAYLRLRNLPVDEMAGTVMVIQLDFEEMSESWFAAESLPVMTASTHPAS